jgi:hypothetical protein
MDKKEDSLQVVTITFKRIQEFLFAVPRLKAMTGANALLGETIRSKLVSQIDPESIPTIPDKILKDNFDLFEKDPLAGDDNPLELYKKGVLSRDGGHLKVIFKNRFYAVEFIDKARAVVSQELPGVQIEAHILDIVTGRDDVITVKDNRWGESPQRLPYFQICQDTGNQVANEYKEGGSPEYTSSKVEHLESAGDRFKKGKTTDIIGMLIDGEKLPGYGDQNKIPDDLEALAGDSGYIAVIHADGNNIGLRRKVFAGNPEGTDTLESYLANERKNEEFFYAMRSAVRISVVNALKEIFNEEVLEKHKKLPYQLLMLGGDDLLLITQPEYAFPFVIEYSKQLSLQEEIPWDEYSQSPISIGAGVAIGRKNVPFYHLHTLAEQLASSAKKLYRSQQSPEDYQGLCYEHSVVDWLVATTSWIDDIELTRRNYDLSEAGNCCTSAKPYYVLNEEGKIDDFTLETLWSRAAQLDLEIKEGVKQQLDDRDKLARSQLKGLLHSISKFNTSVSREKYKKITPKPPALKDSFGEDGESLWHSFTIDNSEKSLTQYKDLIELLEVFYLGKQTLKKTLPVAEQEQGGDK